MKRPNTRERILTTCRELFNARGPVAVTTAEIAAAVDINQGNLYYYFKKKADIVSALFEQFAGRQLATAERAEDLRAWFDLMWEWRFFYRDSATVYAMVPGLCERLQALTDQVEQRNRQTLREMAKAGHLNASDEEIERLLVNAWIVSTYWIDYLRARHSVTRVKKKHLAWGYRQMDALFQPYLNDPWRTVAPTPGEAASG